MEYVMAITTDYRSMIIAAGPTREQMMSSLFDHTAASPVYATFRPIERSAVPVCVACGLVPCMMRPIDVTSARALDVVILGVERVPGHPYSRRFSGYLLNTTIIAAGPLVIRPVVVGDYDPRTGRGTLTREVFR
jgi:hypothetical protein